MANVQQTLDWWLRDDKGELQLVQPPNSAILVAVSTLVASRLPFPEPVRIWLGRTGSSALMGWAIAEVARGSAPIRRVLGGAVLAWQLTRKHR